MVPPRRDESLVPADDAASQRSRARKIEHTLLGVDAPVDAEFEPAPRESGESSETRGHGGSPSGPTGDRAHARREPSRELVVVEPSYSNVPLPPWVRVHEVEADRSASKDLVMLHAPASIAAQQFRTMRYRIEQDPDAQIIAVVSPRAGEGRSVTAANLAIALAEGGRVRVLLIDASLVKPAQASLFGLDEWEGLTRSLRERRDDPHAPVHVYGIRSSLYVLPAGPRVLSAHAALASEQAAHLLGACRRAFRYIVVDASPVFGSAETLAWHGMIDRYILVARRGQTTTDDLGRAAERLHRDKVLGVTFVGADVKHCVA
jgi:Mrp family chromosome partitioning ATPase